MRKKLLQYQQRRQTKKPSSITVYRGFKKLAVQWLQEVQFSNETFVVTDSLVLRNPLLRKAAKRWWQGYEIPERKQKDKRTTLGKTFEHF